MITSKFKSYGIFALALSGLLFIVLWFFIYTIVSVFFLGGHIIPRGTLSPSGAVVCIIVCMLLLAVIFNSWTLFAFNIKIDEARKKILFQNIVTRRTKLYNFTDFDSYLDTYPVTGKGGAYKVLYLLKDKRANKVITGFYYKNVDELQEAISSIKYLGYRKNFSSIARKAFFNRPVIDD